jgi:hypothetical protein
LHLRLDETQTIAECGKMRFVRPNRAAFVVSDDLSFGLVRAFEVYREQKGLSTARVFRTRTAALEWLKS